MSTTHVNDEQKATEATEERAPWRFFPSACSCVSAMLTARLRAS
ncbi:MAG: hypothetical protein RBS80_21125 [Thermoguttaceae bacterium]|nr:hypothetical protein [Thermoguttaceae bacterium]